MPNSDTTRVFAKRLEKKHSKVVVSKTRTNVHLQKKKGGGHKLTAIERKDQQEKRDKKRDRENTRFAVGQARMWKEAQDMAAELGNTPEYWHQKLMQNARLKKSGRKPSHWNAFVALKLEETNKATSKY